MKLEIWEMKKTVSLIAHLKDFDGDTEKWRQAYFMLLSWKNTWNIIYQMDLLESRNDGVYVWIILHEADNAERTINFMKDLGYKEIKSNWVTVGEYELPMSLDYVFEA